MCWTRLLLTLGCSTCLLLLAQPASCGPQPAPQEPPRLALLVGCSTYQDQKINPLPGCVNDVTSFEYLLREKFGFRQITRLSGWPDDASARPTNANISAAFEQLVEQAQPDSQVFILLSGHGTQFPLPESQQNLLDPANPEPDALDEAFLPADYTGGKNMLLDNQIGQWLTALTGKGAHVWIVFDSCHSGTMMRSGTHETQKTITPEQAGIPPEQLQAARKRAETLQQSQPPVRSDGQEIPTPAEGQGSVVAFYAAQEFETAPEVIRPAGSPVKDEFRHGMLAWHTHQLLSSASAGMTYQQLARSLISRYRAERSTTPPTPFFQGQLDREVLGLRTWPKPSPLQLQASEDGVFLSGGELAGLSPGTILSVYAPSVTEQKTALGYVRITELKLDAAGIEPVEYQGVQPVPLAQFPDQSACRVVSQDLGSLKLKLFLQAEPALQGNSPDLQQLLEPVLKSEQAVAELCTRLEEADWLLTYVTPDTAQKTFQQQVEAPALLLVDRSANDPAHPQGTVRAVYSSQELKPESSILASDLRKIFRWRSLWRIADAYSESSQVVDGHSVQLNVRRLTGPEDLSAGTALEDSRLQVGDCVLTRISNTGYDRYWYTVLFLNGDFGVELVGQGSIERRPTVGNPPVRELERIQLSSESSGVEGYLVIAVSQRESRLQPDYSFLTQTSLSEPDQQQPIQRSSLTTPFDQLLLMSREGGSRMRSSVSPGNPQISAWSWVTTSRQSD